MVYMTSYAERETTILIDADLLDRLDRFAARTGVTKTSVIAAALEAHLESHDTTPDLPSSWPLGAATADASRSTGGSIARREAGRRPRRDEVGSGWRSCSRLERRAGRRGNGAEENHGAALAWFGRVNEPLMIGALTLCEVDLLLQHGARPARDAGPARVDRRAGPCCVVAQTQGDLARAGERFRKKVEYRPRLTDAVWSPSLSAWG